MPDDAAGTISVPYTADDGRGLSDSATATVEVHPWEVNSAPEQLTTPTVIVSGTASASLSVLGSWQDPDGDTAYLVSAQGEGLDVRATNEGVVTVRDLQGAPGARELTVVVSDGRQSTSGTVAVDVRGADAQEPVANADHVRVVAGSQAVVSPLDNDSSPSGEALSLAAIEQTPEGTSATLDRRAGTFTFSAEAAGTYYLDYDVAAGAAVEGDRGGGPGAAQGEGQARGGGDRQRLVRLAPVLDEGDIGVRAGRRGRDGGFFFGKSKPDHFRSCHSLLPCFCNPCDLLVIYKI